jgi:hypothetical protein
MGCFTALCPLLPFCSIVQTGQGQGQGQGVSSTQARISSYFTSMIEEKGLSTALGTFDTSLGGLRDFYSLHPAGQGGRGGGISEQTVSEMTAALEEVTWLEQLSGAVDAHHWVLKSGYLSAETLFAEREEGGGEGGGGGGDGISKVKIKSEGGVKRKVKDISQTDPLPYTASSSSKGARPGVFQHIRTFTAACMMHITPTALGLVTFIRRADYCSF